MAGDLTDLTPQEAFGCSCKTVEHQLTIFCPGYLVPKTVALHHEHFPKHQACAQLHAEV
jgi:hypothetical protein